jgi:hypothetical protein
MNDNKGRPATSSAARKQTPPLAPRSNRRARRKPLRAVLLLVLGLYSVWLGYQILAFKKYVTVPEIARAENTSLPSGARPTALPESADLPPIVELRGAYHMHTRHSDGYKTVVEVAAAADRAGLDFVILTDHGTPNFASFDEQRRIGRVLVLAGTEISSSRGHLVALGFKRPAQSFSQNAEDAAREVGALGGFTVIAHPYAKIRWSWGDWADYSGLEIINADADLRRGWVGSLLYAPALLLRPTLALLKTLDPPLSTLRKWDQLLGKNGRGAAGPGGEEIQGYYSNDAHRFFYETELGVLNLHVQLDGLAPVDSAEASQAIFDALRRGRFYSAVEAAADPAGFRFEVTDEKLTPALLHVSTPFSFAHETRIIHEGAVVASGPGRDLTFEAREPGAYRVEVYLRERTPLHPGVPWILANPRLIRKDIP